jgi:hypothetical protein
MPSSPISTQWNDDCGGTTIIDAPASAFENRSIISAAARR